MNSTVALATFTAALLTTTPGLAKPRVGETVVKPIPVAALYCNQCFAVVTAKGQMTSGRGLKVSHTGAGSYYFTANRSVKGCAINATTIAELPEPEAQSLKANHPAVEYYSIIPDAFRIYMINVNGENRDTPFTVSVTC